MINKTECWLFPRDRKIKTVNTETDMNLKIVKMLHLVLSAQQIVKNDKFGSTSRLTCLEYLAYLYSVVNNFFTLRDVGEGRPLTLFKAATIANLLHATREVHVYLTH